MLNARLYRTCWLVAGVALVVALLTLRDPGPGPEPPLPSAIDGQGTLDPGRPARRHRARAHRRLRTRTRRPSRWVQGQLAQVPGAAGRVQTQDFVASDGGEQVRLRNVYLVVPGADGRVRAGILVVAPRDTPARGRRPAPARPR